MEEKNNKQSIDLHIAWFTMSEQYTGSTKIGEMYNTPSIDYRKRGWHAPIEDYLVPVNSKNAAYGLATIVQDGDTYTMYLHPLLSTDFTKIIKLDSWTTEGKDKLTIDFEKLNIKSKDVDLNLINSAIAFPVDKLVWNSDEVEEADWAGLILSGLSSTQIDRYTGANAIFAKIEIYTTLQEYRHDLELAKMQAIEAIWEEEAGEVDKKYRASSDIVDNIWKQYK